MKKSPSTAAQVAKEKDRGVRKKVLLVDDHPMMRAGLAQLINGQTDMTVFAEAGEPKEAFDFLAKTRPDLVLTDLTMPGRSGLDFIKDMLAVHAGLPILVISIHDETMYAERCLRAGARGYIMKESGSKNLLEAMRRILDGQIYVSPRVSELVLANLSAKKPRGSNCSIQALSDREFEVMQLIGAGKSVGEIATQLHLSPKTVEAHRTNIREKLGLKDVAALIRYAVMWLETQGSER